MLEQTHAYISKETFISKTCLHLVYGLCERGFAEDAFLFEDT